MKRLVAILLSAILISPETFVHAKAADLAAEVPESSPSSPPLETDDPGTPGRHGYEINFIVNCDRANSNRSCQTGVDAAFGLGDKAQLRISKYLLDERIAGEAALNGLGPTDIGIKYRFMRRTAGGSASSLAWTLTMGLDGTKRMALQSNAKDV